jgi:hypothetical protein
VRVSRIVRRRDGVWTGDGRTAPSLMERVQLTERRVDLRWVVGCGVERMRRSYGQRDKQDERQVGYRGDRYCVWTRVVETDTYSGRGRTNDLSSYFFTKREVYQPNQTPQWNERDGNDGASVRCDSEECCFLRDETRRSEAIRQQYVGGDVVIAVLIDSDF